MCYRVLNALQEMKYRFGAIKNAGQWIDSMRLIVMELHTPTPILKYRFKVK